MTDKPKPTIQRASIDAQVIAERLAKCEIGGEVSYSELNKIINRDVQVKARSVLDTARRMVFGVIMNVGLRRLNDVEIVGTGQHTIDHIRKTSKRGAVRLGCVKDFNSMPTEARIKHNAALSTLGTLAHFTGSAAQAKVCAAVEVANGKLPLAKLLAAVRSESVQD